VVCGREDAVRPTLDTSMSDNSTHQLELYVGIELRPTTAAATANEHNAPVCNVLINGTELSGSGVLIKIEVNIR